MPSLLVIVAEILLLFLAAWFAFWLIDRISYPADPAPPIKMILQIIIVILFLIILFGLFGAFGSSWHPALFSR